MRRVGPLARSGYMLERGLSSFWSSLVAVKMNEPCNAEICVLQLVDDSAILQIPTTVHNLRPIMVFLCRGWRRATFVQT